ncbi:MAG TPA: DNA cytosine methyltransferase, partial [Vicinamibacterales bacterium]|nr:DNA cytosine methyltransferase [Vicinamibacterales bacterium]
KLAHTQKVGSGSGYTNGVVETEGEKQTAAFGASFDVNYGCPVEEELAHTQTNGTCPGHHSGVVREETPGVKATVRRLLPVETERLMGFPDGWTQIPWKGKPAEECPDAPRYKACGNSMCVNVMRWIGLRIEAEERRIQDERGKGDEGGA